MPQGLEVYDASATLIFSTNTRVGVLLGYIDIGNTDGSASDANLSKGTPFSNLFIFDLSYASISPKVEISGTTITWTWRTSGDSGNPNCRILYGVR